MAAPLAGTVVLPGAALMIVIGAGLLISAAYLKLFDRRAKSAPGRQRFATGAALVLAVLVVLAVLGTTQVVGGGCAVGWREPAAALAAACAWKRRRKLPAV